MKIIQRDVTDDFEAFSIANMMEEAGVSVFCITNSRSIITPNGKENWKVWGKGADEAIEKFFRIEIEKAESEEESTKNRKDTK